MDTLMKPMSLALVWKHWLQHIKATLPDKTMRDPIAQKKKTMRDLAWKTETYLEKQGCDDEVAGFKIIWAWSINHEQQLLKKDEEVVTIHMLFSTTEIGGRCMY
jgi:hypothetical protein